MDATTVFLLILVLIIVATVVMGANERRSEREKTHERNRRLFGQVPEKKMSRERYAQVPGYWNHHRSAAQIDDITWNDLEMDRIYARIDAACSGPGEEYLYYLLRTPAQSEEDFGLSQEELAYFAQKEEERLQVMDILSLIGHTGRYSIYDYLGALEELPDRSSARDWVALFLPLVGIGLLFVSVPLGVVSLLVLCAVNIVTYFREKAEIDPYVVVFAYLLRLLGGAEQLSALSACGPFAGKQERLGQIVRDFAPFRRGSTVLMSGGRGDPLGMLLDYLRILFHLDLIKFSSMLRQYRGHREEVDELITIVGQIDAAISIASFRRSLGSWAVPELHEESVPGEDFAAEGLVHPLLADPVANTIAAPGPVLLTGSNASGKSTFIKACALCALLSQTIRTAPAESYRGRYYRIYSSMALRDDLESGESYFIVEIRSIKRILDAANEPGPVLCCIDEVLRGTNTVERIAASTEILEGLSRMGVLCFAATHDIELTELLRESYANYHFSELLQEGDVRFSYTLQKGPATTRNAIRLLASMGYDDSIVRHAQERAEHFLQNGEWK